MCVMVVFFSPHFFNSDVIHQGTHTCVANPGALWPESNAGITTFFEPKIRPSDHPILTRLLVGKVFGAKQEQKNRNRHFYVNKPPKKDRERITCGIMWHFLGLFGALR